MAESTLSLSYTNLCSRVGRFLGYGPTSGNWLSAQVTQIDELVNSGYRLFLTPPAIDGIPEHEWTFMRPTTTQAIVSGTYNYTLPDSFGGIESVLTFASTDSQLGPIKIVGEEVIRKLREGQSSSTGIPCYAAIRPLNVSAGATAGQRFEMILWPTPNGSYTLTYRYFALVSALSASLLYALGGQRHSETLLAACLARAEEEANDTRGIYWARFVESLKGSIRADQRGFEREYYGYNGDRSDREASHAVKGLPSRVTINGV